MATFRGKKNAPASPSFPINANESGSLSRKKGCRTFSLEWIFLLISLVVEQGVQIDDRSCSREAPFQTVHQDGGLFSAFSAGERRRFLRKSALAHMIAYGRDHVRGKIVRSCVLMGGERHFWERPRTIICWTEEEEEEEERGRFCALFPEFETHLEKFVENGGGKKKKSGRFLQRKLDISRWSCRWGMPFSTPVLPSGNNSLPRMEVRRDEGFSSTFSLTGEQEHMCVFASFASSSAAEFRLQGSFSPP